MAEILGPSSRKRKLAAILHADVVGFSRLMGEDETATHEALGKLRHAVDPLITAHAGRIVGTAGDSLLADVSSVIDALSCAVEMQRAALAINEPIPPQCPIADPGRGPVTQARRREQTTDDPMAQIGYEVLDSFVVPLSAS